MSVMKSALSNIFTTKDTDRISCTIVSRRGVSSYVVQDSMGRSFIVSGEPGLKELQKVTVKNKEIVGKGLSNKLIRTVSV